MPNNFGVNPFQTPWAIWKPSRGLLDTAVIDALYAVSYCPRRHYAVFFGIPQKSKVTMINTPSIQRNVLISMIMLMFREALQFYANQDDLTDSSDDEDEEQREDGETEED